ncbi:hypothetical protein Tco_0875041 [Tanacetum coccineum]|uniref:Uncharacterized protein n=1 Tax=Tanacetum coccineum TaxID=301880 RepID=A0ABQ5BNC7_9ASTR
MQQTTSKLLLRHNFETLFDQGVLLQWLKQKQEEVRNAMTAHGSGKASTSALRESSDSLDGLRKWSICLALAIAQHLVKSKFSTCTLQDDALTWWNAHVKTTTPEVAHAMPWGNTEENDD